MKKIILFLSSFCMVSFAASAQKDAPVAGHAANLVDLLKKDYNAIDPVLRGDEIIKDRALVISIFKSYFTEQQRANFNNGAFGLESKAKLTKDALDKLNIVKRKVTTLNSISANPVNKDLNAMVASTEVISTDLEKMSSDYLAKKCEFDIEELHLILDEYESENNQYIVYSIDLFITKYQQLKLGTDSFASTNYTAAITKSLPFVGGELAFEAVVDGLSRFLAKRIKEELTNQVIQRVSEWLKNKGDNDPLAEFKVMLPRTTQYLIGFQPDKITSFPDEIKQYIEDDLNHALENAANLKDTPGIRTLIEEHPDLDFAMEAIEMIPNLSKLKNPADYFKTIENSRNLRRWKIHGNTPARFNIANLVQLSCMIGQSMTIIDNGELRFAGKDFMGAYVGEKNFYLLYLGFLYQQNVKYYKVEFQYKEDSNRKNMILTTELKRIISKPVNTDFTPERNFFNFMLTGIGDNAEKVLLSATEIRKANKAGKKIGADSIYNFVESMIKLSENVVFASGALIDYLEVGNAEHLPRIKQGRASLDRIAAPYFIVARSFNEIAFDIQKSKYANALIKVIELKDKLADEAVVSNADIMARVTHFDYIHVYPTVKYWPKVIAYVRNTNIQFATVAKSCDTLFHDLTYIKDLANEIYGKDTKPAALENAIVFINSLSIEAFEKRDDKIQELNVLLTNVEFLKIATAYYTGTFADRMIDPEEIKEKRKRFPYNGSDTTFDTVEIKNINTTATLHVQSLSKFLADGQETKEMLDTKNNLEKMVKVYLKTFDVLTPNRPSQKVVSLIHFVNDMAIAKDAEDVEKAIEAFALPVGSYTIKRKSKFNVSLNSFPGILPAVERPWKKDISQHGDNPGNSFSLGFTAPVGLSVTWGKCGWSKGFYITAIDIGAVTRLRLDNDKNTTTLPKITLENFISPGLYFHLGIKDTPLSVNIGAQFGPQMRKIDTSNGPINYDSMRFGIGIVLDIPLVNLYTKPYFEEK